MSQAAERIEFPSTLDDTHVKVTPAAQAKLAELLQEADDEIEAVRIYVTGGGCSGMTYGMTFTDQRSPWDAVREAGDVKIYVDSVALAYLKGVEIDYVEHATGASFVFNNVFAATGGTGACSACGAATGPGGGGCA